MPLKHRAISGLLAFFGPIALVLAFSMGAGISSEEINNKIALEFFYTGILLLGAFLTFVAVRWFAPPRKRAFGKTRQCLVYSRGHNSWLASYAVVPPLQYGLWAAFACHWLRNGLVGVNWTRAFQLQPHGLVRFESAWSTLVVLVVACVALHFVRSPSKLFGSPAEKSE
ncbi:MAG: hypothetical protein V1754_06040 [Pseudomonadota bacterium]